MTVRKKIIFEGQEIGLSQTMQKLQRQAEQMSSKLLDNYSKSARSSKEFVKSLEEEYKNSQRLIQLQSQDKRFQILENYEKKLAEVNRKEEEHYKKLQQRGLSGSALDSEMSKVSTGFQEQRLSAGSVRDSAIEELKKSTDQQKQTNELLKQMLTEDKNQWEQEFRQNRKGVEAFLQSSKGAGLDNLTPEQRAKYAYQQALVSEEKQAQFQDKQSVLKDIIGAGLIRDMGSIISQMPSARDAYDLVPGITRMMGAGLGALGGGTIGAGLGLLSLIPDPGKGAIAGATFGAEVGQRAGDFAGTALGRFFEEQENLQRSLYGFIATTGREMQKGKFSQFGFTNAQAGEIGKVMALQLGSGDVDVTSLLGTQTGFGIDQGTLMQFSRARRRTGGEFGAEMSNLLGTARDSGIDRVLFNELIQNQTQLINSLGQMTERVDPKNITALMMELNNVGGGFSMSDPRSMGFVQSLQQGLTNPNEFGQAMNLSILRQMNPDASILDMLEAQEQGLGGEKGRELLRGTVQQFTNMFGDKDLAVLALRSRFPGIPISDLKRLVNGEDVIGSMQASEMKATEDLIGQGNVSERAKLQAQVTNAFSVGALDGLTAIEQQMEGLFSQVFEKAMLNIDYEKIKEEVEKKSDDKIGSMPIVGYWWNRLRNNTGDQ